MSLVTETSQRPTSPLSRLQRLAKPREVQERCELCGANITSQHSHLLELKSRQLLCSCEACAILFSGNEAKHFRRVTSRAQMLTDLPLTDDLWESLHIPINLAFFYLTGTDRKPVAMYPSPAGATESLLPLDAWQQLAENSMPLQKMQSEVEALLVNRMGQHRESYLVSIDQCYQLVGIIRTNWRGLSGGTEVWREIERFFKTLRERATLARTVAGGAAHA